MAFLVDLHISVYFPVSLWYLWFCWFLTQDKDGFWTQERFPVWQKGQCDDKFISFWWFSDLSWEVNWKGQKKPNFMAPLYWWGSIASRLQPLRGGSLLFTIHFPEIPSTHFINLGSIKGWVDLGATQWFWTRYPGLGIKLDRLTFESLESCPNNFLSYMQTSNTVLFR